MLKATLATAFFLAGFAPFAASAMQMPQAPGAATNPAIVQVFGGCGPYGHRGPYGACRAGGQAGGYIPGRSCPRGFHIGPYGRHCFPN